MKKFLIAILIMLSVALLFGCSNKNATIVSAQKVGTKGNFDVYQLTYSNGFESLIEVGDNTVVESISVLNGGIVYNYYNSGNTTNDDELPRKEVSTNKDEASDKTEGSTGKEESTNNNSTISGTLTDGTVIFNNNYGSTMQPVIKYEGALNTGTLSHSISFVQMFTLIPACEHSFGEYTHLFDATCAVYGQDIATCSKCGCTLTYCTAKLEHDYDTETVLTKNPTCTKEGYEYYKCKNCFSQQKICILEKSDEHTFKDGFCVYCKKHEDEVKD